MKKVLSKVNTWSVLKGCLSRFSDDNVVMMSNSMVYSSLVALIPCLAFVYTFLSHLGFTEPVIKLVEQFLLETFGTENGNVLIEYLNKFLNNAMSLGIISFLSFFVTFLLLIDTLHVTLNKIFHCSNKSNIAVRLGKYAISMIVGMIVIALSVTFYTRVLASWLPFGGASVPSELESVCTQLISKAIGYFTLFGLLYYLPDTPVLARSAANGAAFGGILVYLLEYGFKLVVKFSVSKFVIYGSLAAVLFFFMFLSWLWRIIFTSAVFTNVLDRKLKETV
jgi:membrane protein